ncbi:SWI/SNF-related matrix-associated actin-dependent regulator of chromatin subfamily E member 1-related [Frankliniella fusca]|uniref:SWI/SNF-related matrix-associated actin-dependent regulator of chromatin subfamily E member 1-related n=1 Tax=Frankliniella fusca TaxID=407009 RepID=A0AAE1HVF1_9NEOP|nr:SWI/SNF-related matrix-associated actin-dependent regulator of chromatin subfamily E member 1-related [Frankliniella fusca]
MGRNAYINFYIWFYNEHRGQAPVTTIAKRAGVTWRKMTPQERDRFTDRINYPKGNVPLYLRKRKKGTNNPVTSNTQHRTGIKSKGHSNQRAQLKNNRHGKKTILSKTGKQEKIQMNSNHQIQGQGKDKTEENQTDQNQNDESDGNSEEEKEPEEITARRKSIQKWMDENHYT